MNIENLLAWFIGTTKYQEVANMSGTIRGLEGSK